MLDTDELLKALKDAISAANGKPSAVKPNKPAPAPVAIEEDGFDQEDLEMLSMGKEDDDIPFDTEDDIFDEPELKEEPKLIKLSKERLATIRKTFQTADDSVRKEVRKFLANYNNKLADEMLDTDVISIETLLQI